VREFLRLAPSALLCASLACARPARTGEDGGGPKETKERPERLKEAAGASVEGRIRWLGQAPTRPRLLTNASVQRVCGPSVADNAFQLDGQGGVAEVVVWVEAPAAPLPAGAGQQVVVDQAGCLYRPAVLAARAGGVLRLRNSDPLTHTVHATLSGRTLFNVAMPLENAELSLKLPPEPSVLDLRCDVHPWMQAVVRTFDHPHFTTTGADGRFRLLGLLAAAADVHAWHPKLGEAVRHVQLAEGVTRVDFDFGGRP
jgi:hypothetical protein